MSRATLSFPVLVLAGPGLQAVAAAARDPRLEIPVDSLVVRHRKLPERRPASTSHDAVIAGSRAIGFTRDAAGVPTRSPIAGGRVRNVASARAHE